MRLKTFGNRDEAPTEWEQDVAEIYVSMRRLIRPDASIKKAAASVVIFVAVTGFLTWLLYFVLIPVGVISYLPAFVRRFSETEPILSVIVICLIVVFAELFFCLKYAVIGIIKLYQRYAPDDIRRRCLFMPTCSEYAVLSVRKYGVIIGLWKSYVRLVYRCKGNIYMIDYPWDKN